LRYDGSNLDKLRAQARNGRIYAVVWTWRKHRVVKTKREGQRLLRVWKTWHERRGWTVKSGDSGYRAYPPGYDPLTPPVRQVGVVRSIGLHTYDAQTKERIWEPPVSKPKPERPAVPRPRRRRKPIGA
jgi:hypothetical protein